MGLLSSDTVVLLPYLGAKGYVGNETWIIRAQRVSGPDGGDSGPLVREGQGSVVNEETQKIF